MHAYMPRFWNRSCSADCQHGQEIQRGCERHYIEPHNLCGACWLVEGIAVDRYDHREDCPRHPKYLGTVAKGWWHLWTLRDPLWRWETQLVFAVGGEDSMVQLSINLPILGRFAFGVKVPRALTRPWVYNRREFGFELRGLRPTLYLGYDEQARDMRGYYLVESGTSSCVNCGATKWVHDDPEKAGIYADRLKGCPGFQFGLPKHVTRLSLRAGLKLELSSRWWRRHARVKDRLLGKVEIVNTVLKVVEPVTVTLPEGPYPGKVTFFRERVKRPRWRVIRDDVYGKFESEVTMPWPGKGENSYDCGDDGSREFTAKVGPGGTREHEIGGGDVAKVIAGTVGKVIGYRARYGRFDWEPESVGVLRD